MLGIFDSGRGGQNVLAVLRGLAPFADIAYFADTLGAPYGTKSREELFVRILHDEAILRRAGCERILIGCCTASTLYDMLPKNTRARLFPIVEETSKEAAKVTKNGKIAVLCTEASCRADTFGICIQKYSPDADVITVPSQAYVGLAEADRINEGDEAFERQLRFTLEILKKHNADTAILGCTHFHPLGIHLKRHMPSLRVVSSAEVGARAFLGTASYHELSGGGVTVYL